MTFEEFDKLSHIEQLEYTYEWLCGRRITGDSTLVNHRIRDICKNLIKKEILFEKAIKSSFFYEGDQGAKR